jgi:hypothetical protein
LVSRLVAFFDLFYSKRFFKIAGESNSGYNRDKYICTFSKMIQYWRQVWNTRTNGITNPDFPFGFVQVKLSSIFHIKHILLLVINKS